MRVLAELAGLDLAHLTPIEALNLLAKWQDERRSKSGSPITKR